jgi:drug/metabolite transporter (DMT)-like permease
MRQHRQGPELALAPGRRRRVTAGAKRLRAQRPTGPMIAGALTTLYLVWGSTYLAIAVLVDVVPPLTAAGTRFLLAGSVLAVFVFVARGRRGIIVKGGEVAAAVGVSVLTLFAAFSLLFLGETRVPSGLAALLIASIPLWVVLVRLIAGERVDYVVLGAVAAGFVGVGALLVPGTQAAAPLVWMFVILGAALAEALGAFASQRLDLPEDPLVSATVQMLFAGALTLLVGIAAGERVDMDEISLAGIAALAYLVIPGSLLAYTAFVWLLQNTSVSTGTTYAYINPVVALSLGWAVANEPVSQRTFVSAAIIIAAVAVVLRREAPRGSDDPPRNRGLQPTPRGSQWA